MQIAAEDRLCSLAVTDKKKFPTKQAAMNGISVSYAELPAAADLTD